MQPATLVDSDRGPILHAAPGAFAQKPTRMGPGAKPTRTGRSDCDYRALNPLRVDVIALQAVELLPGRLIGWMGVLG